MNRYARLACATTIATCLAVSFAQAEEPPVQPPPANSQKQVYAHDIGVCLNAADRSLCALNAIERARPSERLTLAAMSDLAPSGADPADTSVDVTTLREFRDILRADRRGLDPKASLLGSNALPMPDRIGVLSAVCAIGLGQAAQGDGPQYIRWQNSIRPTRKLLAATADGLEQALASFPNGNMPADLLGGAAILGACRAKLDDMDGVDRAAKLLPSTDPPIRLYMLIGGGRLEDAADVLARLTPKDFERAESRAYPGVFPYVFLQRERLRLLWSARNVGRVDIADRAADMILASGVAPDRPLNAVMDSGVGTALVWLAQRPDRTNALMWADRVDTIARPGARGWNSQDAVDLYAVWRLLGREDRARALYDAVAATASKTGHTDPTTLADQAEEAGHVLGVLLALEHRWDDPRVTPYLDGVLNLDIQTGVASREMPDLLAHAKSRDDHDALLRYCATDDGAAMTSDGSAPERLPLPLGMEAGCVRELIKRGALEQPLDLPPELATKMHHDWGYGTPNAAIMVAYRAARVDQPELSREMLSLALQAWLAPAADGQKLDDRSITLIAETAMIDLHARGKL